MHFRAPPGLPARARVDVQRALAQSTNKALRELSRYTHLLPLCDACMNGRIEKKGRIKLESRLGDEVRPYMAHLSSDTSGKQSVKS